MYLNTFSKYFSNLIVEHFQQLNEYKTSPNRLSNLASNIDALCGIEFEVMVPVRDDYNHPFDHDTEDYPDEECESIDNVINFFNQTEVNDRSTIQHLRFYLSTAYDDYVESVWYSDGLDYFIRLKRHILMQEYEAEEYQPDDVDQYISDKARQHIDEEDELCDEVKNRFIESYCDEESWLVSHYGSMVGIYSAFAPSNLGLRWPSNFSSTKQFKSVAEMISSFEQALNCELIDSMRKRNTVRSNTKWVVEKDPSVDYMDGVLNCEFVSPPIPIQQMPQIINAFQQWALSNGCQTNDSTGLHINISINGLNNATQLDYVKLALMLGDRYILDKFDRYGNDYTESSVDIISKLISQSNVQRLEHFFNLMKSKLDHFASRAIHDVLTDKYVSIRGDTNRIEYRGPGGNYLNQDLDVLIATLMRCVVALDIAYDPNKHRQEYLTKLYKLLRGSHQSFISQDQDPLGLFVRYSSGGGGSGAYSKILASIFKSNLKQRKQDREQNPKIQSKLPK